MGTENEKLSAKRYLGQLEIIDIKIQQKLEELNDLKSDACNIGSIDYGRERVQQSGNGDNLSREVVRYVSLRDNIDTEIDEFVNIKHQIIREIQSLNDSNYIQILFKIYVQYKSLKAASGEMKMSYQHARKIHREALDLFEEKYPERYYLT